MKLVEKDGAVRLEVYAKPRAKKSRIGAVRADGSLEVALAAPPVDGAANEELLKTLAKALGVRQKDVVVVRGASSRTKLVEIGREAGLDADEVRSRLLSPS